MKTVLAFLATFAVTAQASEIKGQIMRYPNFSGFNFHVESDAGKYSVDQKTGIPGFLVSGAELMDPSSGVTFGQRNLTLANVVVNGQSSSGIINADGERFEGKLNYGGLEISSDRHELFKVAKFESPTNKLDRVTYEVNIQMSGQPVVGTIECSKARNYMIGNNWLGFLQTSKHISCDVSLKTSANDEQVRAFLSFLTSVSEHTVLD